MGGRAVERVDAAPGHPASTLVGDGVARTRATGVVGDRARSPWAGRSDRVTAAVALAPDEHAIVRGLWRGIEVFRVLALAYAAWSLYERRGDVLHPTAAVAVLAVLAAWTVAQTVRPMRTVRAYTVELALGCLAILATRLVDDADVITSGAKTLPSIWPSAAIAGFAVLRGWRGGVAAGCMVAAFSFIEVVRPTANTVTNSILGLLLGGCIGYCVDLARESHEALREAMRRDAARAERDRLARTVHDGVLQTLAYINRRAVDLGGEAVTLGAMAAEQERILRTLVSQDDLGEVDRAMTGATDLRATLRHVEAPGVQLVSPAEPITLPRRVADEVAAAVEAALDNVRKHAGEGARAWVLLDDDGRTVSVTIRDSGAGLPEGRLEQAAGQGRLGVASSIRGRLDDLGGSARISSVPGHGTTVELRVPSAGR